MIDEGFDPEKTAKRPNFEFNDYVTIWDWAESYKFYKGKLPGKMTQDTLDKLLYIASMNGVSYFDGEGEFEKVYTSKMFSTILESLDYRMKYLHKYGQVEDLRDNEKEKYDYEMEIEGRLKYLGFSGHDSNIYPILFALKTTSVECLKTKFISMFKDPEPSSKPLMNIFLKEDNLCFTSPSFSSNLELLLLRNTQSGKFYIHVLYNGEELPICKTSESPTQPCPVDTTLSYFKTLMISEDLEELCFGQQLVKKYKFGIYFSVAGAFFVVVMIMACKASHYNTEFKRIEAESASYSKHPIRQTNASENTSSIGRHLLTMSKRE